VWPSFETRTTRAPQDEGLHFFTRYFAGDDRRRKIHSRSFLGKRIDPSQIFEHEFSEADAADLICVNLRPAKPSIVFQITRERVMPIESALVTVFVLVVFVGFALVLVWAEYQTRSLKKRDSHIA
jgi:hypothetical protein